MISRLIVLLSVLSLIGCESASVDLLTREGYTDIDFQYESVSEDTIHLRAICDFDQTLVFKAKNKKQVTKTVLVCLPSNEIYELVNFIG